MKKPTIALADDHEEFRLGLRDFLTCYDFEVLYHKPDGAQLVQEMFCNNKLPDICILDLEMINQDGIVTAKQIHSRWPHIKIVLYTMALVPAKNAELEACGIVKYIPKSNSPVLLVDTLRQLARA
jgi:DNA-binding NarL/FixJ family response regulator